ncbi:MAG TPA: hypothetical protein VGR16_01730 [Thermomicrobiales bacterium]|nr:hypothetical protein [Thermomicrobiales bacterium]
MMLGIAEHDIRATDIRRRQLVIDVGRDHMGRKQSRTVRQPPSSFVPGSVMRMVEMFGARLRASAREGLGESATSFAG